MRALAIAIGFWGIHRKTIICLPLGGFAVRNAKSGGLALPREPSCAGGGGGGLFRVSATLFLFFVQGLGSDRYDYLGSCLN